MVLHDEEVREVIAGKAGINVVVFEDKFGEAMDRFIPTGDNVESSESEIENGIFNWFVVNRLGILGKVTRRFYISRD